MTHRPSRTAILSLICFAVLLIAGLLFYLWGIDSWKFAYIGDEWDFFIFAKDLIGRGSSVHAFQMDGVFDKNPVLGSLWQALFLALFGATNTAWRLSNIVLYIPMGTFLYLWLKDVFGLPTARYGLVLLGFSAPLANFFKIGYVNPIAIALLVILLYIAHQAATKSQAIYAVVAGVLLGISFYIHLGLIFPLIIGVYIMLVALVTDQSIPKRQIAIMLTVYLVCITPGVQSMRDGTYLAAVRSEELMVYDAESAAAIGQNILSIFGSFFFNLDPFNNHFVSGPHLDLISRTLFLFGMVWGIWVVKLPYARAIFGTYILTCIVSAVLSPDPWIGVTRSIILVPFGLAFASIALGQLHTRYRHLAVVLTIAIVCLNMYQSQHGVFAKEGHHAFSLLLRETSYARENNYSHVMLLDGRNLTLHDRNLATMLAAYQLEGITFVHSLVDENPIRCDDPLNNTYHVVRFADDSVANHYYLANLPCQSMVSYQVLTNYYYYQPDRFIVFRQGSDGSVTRQMDVITDQSPQ